MRLANKAKFAVVAACAASGMALAAAPANAATQPLQKVSCSDDPAELRFYGFASLLPTCYKGTGDLDVVQSIVSSFTTGTNSGFVVFRDGSKVTFDKGQHLPGQFKDILHIHTN
ncbi:hypothetical protein [Streptomyces cinnamoneus]|uniref:Uncharacterized protein n=1 Tax=Streptomyces cinnamoneus TaxID=53446 RepID=A0A918TVE4_STRCJ|nr:hypothetical protein [Streptomyces cinnamoneus]GHC60642.1 hypothetical protein GCM10010507_42050 [Streptomyces cinnamoneus]